MVRRRLTFTERMEISTGSKAGWGVRKIASHLGRCPSVVSRELRPNSTKTRGYQAVTADVKAQRQRRLPPRILSWLRLRARSAPCRLPLHCQNPPRSDRKRSAERQSRVSSARHHPPVRSR